MNRRWNECTKKEENHRTMLLNYMVIISWLKLLYLFYNVNPFVICILAFGSCRFERLISVYIWNIIHWIHMLLDRTTQRKCINLHGLKRLVCVFFLHFKMRIKSINSMTNSGYCSFYILKKKSHKIDFGTLATVMFIVLMS